MNVIKHEYDVIVAAPGVTKYHRSCNGVYEWLDGAYESGLDVNIECKVVSVTYTDGNDTRSEINDDLYYAIERVLDSTDTPQDNIIIKLSKTCGMADVHKVLDGVKDMNHDRKEHLIIEDEFEFGVEHEGKILRCIYVRFTAHYYK